jgi:hypothetical protein
MGVTSMAEYRLYRTNGAGGIAAGEWLDASSDDEAIALARAKKLSVKCELWKRDQFVAEIASSSARNQTRRES